jgi:hypothetical protein
MRQAGKVLDSGAIGCLDTAAIDETAVCQDNNFVVRAGFEVEAELVEAGTIEAELVELVEA